VRLRPCALTLWVSICPLCAWTSWALERMPIALMVEYHKSVDKHPTVRTKPSIQTSENPNIQYTHKTPRKPQAHSPLGPGQRACLQNEVTTRDNYTREQNPMIHHIAFYKFSSITDVNAVVTRLREMTVDLLGSILVATEGINGMLAGSAQQLDGFEHALQNDAAFNSAFQATVFKRTECQTPPFKRMKVHAKAEIVPLGISGVDAAGRTADIVRTNVSPAQWRDLIHQPDVVLLDNRNSFEYRLGKFDGAIDPGVVNFRDFPEYVKAHAEQWKVEHKKVAMYCTGGIRCEKSSVWMQDLGLDVYQLEGGILNYFKEMPDAQKDWQGECFVFDNRVALDTHLHETPTTVEDVYQDEPDGEWRLKRAQQLNS
jgi:UPF0176 protein